MRENYPLPLRYPFTRSFIYFYTFILSRIDLESRRYPREFRPFSQRPLSRPWALWYCSPMETPKSATFGRSSDSFSLFHSLSEVHDLSRSSTTSESRAPLERPLLPSRYETEGARDRQESSIILSLAYPRTFTSISPFSFHARAHMRTDRNTHESTCSPVRFLSRIKFLK